MRFGPGNTRSGNLAYPCADADARTYTNAGTHAGASTHPSASTSGNTD